MTNGGRECQFEACFEQMRDCWGEIHDGIPTLMSLALPPAVPRFILATGFCGADQGCPIQPCLIDIKDEEAMLICCRIAKAVKLSAIASRTPFCDFTAWFVRILHTDTVPQAADARFASWFMCCGSLAARSCQPVAG